MGCIFSQILTVRLQTLRLSCWCVTDTPLTLRARMQKKWPSRDCHLVELTHALLSFYRNGMSTGNVNVSTEGQKHRRFLVRKSSDHELPTYQNPHGALFLTTMPARLSFTCFAPLMSCQFAQPFYPPPCRRHIRPISVLLIRMSPEPCPLRDS